MIEFEKVTGLRLNSLESLVGVEKHIIICVMSGVGIWCYSFSSNSGPSFHDPEVMEVKFPVTSA